MRKHLSLWVFMVLFVRTVMAQNGYTVEHYTSENGLPQNSVKSISADSEGFIWLATEDGLVRFDGHRFSVFNRFNLNVSDNRVRIIHPSSRETLTKNIERGNDRTSVAFAIMGSYEHVKIANGRAVKDTTYYVRSGANFRRLESLDGIYKRVIEVPGLPNFSVTRPSETWFRFMLTTGNAEGSFYLCEHDHVSYFKNWQKKHDFSFYTYKIHNYFTIGERLYYFDGASFLTKFYDGKAEKFALQGDILEDPGYRQKKKTSKYTGTIIQTKLSSTSIRTSIC